MTSSRRWFAAALAAMMAVTIAVSWTLSRSPGAPPAAAGEVSVTAGSVAVTSPTTVPPAATTPPTTVDPAAVFEFLDLWAAATATTTTTSPPSTVPPTTRYVPPTTRYLPPPTIAAAPSGSGGGLPQFLVCVRQRESKGIYSINTGNGYYGAFQFLASTWNTTAAHAGRRDLVGVLPSNASPADQDAMAIALYQWQGRSPWEGPGC